METQIDTSPEQRAVRYHEEMLAGLQRTIEAAWHCGEALEAVKRSRRHGEWLPWLASVGIAERTAQRCMRLRRQFPQIRQLDGFAGVGAALKALPVGEKKAEALLHAEKHFRRALEACRAAAKESWHCGRTLAALARSNASFPAKIPRDEGLKLISETEGVDLDTYVERYLEKAL